MSPGPRIIGIVGWKNSGKTRLVAALVAELTGRGWTVSTVKHAHHEFDIDRQGADSWQHRQAGAREVAIVSERRWALMHEIAPDADEPPLDAMLARLSPCDFVIVEGYKRGSHDKIEIRRDASATTQPLAPADPNIVAVVTDEETAGGGLPVFAPDDVAPIADFIELHTGMQSGRSSRHGG